MKKAEYDKKLAVLKKARKEAGKASHEAYQARDKANQASRDADQAYREADQVWDKAYKAINDLKASWAQENEGK